MSVLGHIRERLCSYKVYIYVFKGEIQLLTNISTTYKQFSKIQIIEEMEKIWGDTNSRWIKVKVYMCSSYYSSYVPVIWKFKNKKSDAWDSLAVQWLRIHLPMHRSWVSSLVQEDPTWQGKSKPMCHNYWAHTIEPTGCNYWPAGHSYWSLCAPESRCYNRRSHVSEKLCPADN